MSKTASIIVVLIFLLAGFLRLSNLGKSSFWVDEMNHVYVSQSILTDGSLSLPSGETYDRAAVFAYATALSARLFGVNEFSIRLPSALFGLVALFFIFIFTRRLLGVDVAIVAVFLLAILPFEVGWARTARFYTLFQLFTILTWYAFYRGFEGAHSEQPGQSDAVAASGLARWQINWGWLLGSAAFALLAISTQVIGVFLLLGLFIYLVSAAGFRLITDRKSPVLQQKHFVFAAAATCLVLLAAIAVPQVREIVRSGLTFAPAWAQYEVAQDRFLFVKFLMDKELFPLGVFFMIGVLQAVLRVNRVIFYSLIIFVVPIALFTVVFSYRMYQYMYNIFPLFVIIASYGLVNFINLESGFLKEGGHLLKRLLPGFRGTIRPVVLSALVLTLPFTEFFKDSMAIPSSRPGSSNGAFTHLEWREATQFVETRLQDDSVVLSTLPITIRHYLKRANYNMNLADYDLAREKSLMNKRGQVTDFYTGVPFVQSVTTLDSVVVNHQSGFVIIDTYRLLGSQYISTAVREYLRERMDEIFVSPAQTVRVYHWANGSSSPIGELSKDMN